MVDTKLIAEEAAMAPPAWEIVVGGTHRWEPHERAVYTCTRVSTRGKRYFARLNNKIMGTASLRVFMGTLDKCKTLCREHWHMNSVGGEVP